MPSSRPASCRLRLPMVALAVLLFVLTSSSSAAVNPIFRTTPTYATGGSPSSLAVADVNGDGIADLVVTNGIGVVVLLGHGDGTYEAAIGYRSGGLVADSVAVADVNGDGKPDLLVGAVSATAVCLDGPSLCPGVVGVLLGNGDGSFQTAIPYSSGGLDALSVVVADVNRDGKPDLIVANLNGLGVLLGNGDGTFQPPVTRSFAGTPIFLALKDVNGDSMLDAVVANSEGGTVEVLLGNGNGTFQPAVTYLTGGHRSNSAAIGDVNADGKIDLLVADTDVDGNGTVELLLGNGDGTFQPPVSHGVGAFAANSVATADMNGDGKLDLIVAGSCTACTNGIVSMQLGNGDGTFQPPVNYASGGSQSDSLAVGDVNEDGKLDVLVSNGSGVGVLVGNGNGTLQAGMMYDAGGFSPDSTVVGDVNGDGIQDLIVLNICTKSNDCSSGSVGVLLGNGDVTFKAPLNYDSGGALPLSVAVGDVNGDGKLDLIVANQCAKGSNCPNDTSTVGTLEVLLGKGDGTFQSPVGYSSGGYRAYSVVLGDVNQDGKLDVVVANSCVSGSNCVNGSASVLLGNGDGAFQPAVSYSSGGSSAQSVVLEDLNQDGKLDLVVANYCASGFDCFVSSSPTGVIGVLLGNGDGTFREAGSYGSGGFAAYALAIGDINGDGRPDLVVANRCLTFACANSGGISVLLGNGNSTFQAPLITSTPSPATKSYPGTGVQSLVLADFDGDGKVDVASSGNSLLLGNGDGTFQAPVLLGPSSQVVAVGDFNGDGKPDLAAGGVTILMNLSSMFPHATTTVATSTLNQTFYGQPMVFDAVVTPDFYVGAVTGSVTFYDGTSALSTVPVNFGRATFSTSSLSSGTHSITAAYAGDLSYEGSVSSPLDKTVLPATLQPIIAIGATLERPLNVKSSGVFVALVTIANNSNVNLDSVQVTLAGTMLGLTPLLATPPPVMNLAPGASATVKLKFLPNADSSTNTIAPLKLSGTYSVTSTAPSFSGNWSLNFRSVTLP
jgi:hypothetical protein